MDPRFCKGLWRLADPKVSLASFSSLFLGTCAAYADGPLSVPWLAATVLGIFAVEVAKNASGEIVDFDSGTDLAVASEDRSPFSGGKRVIVEGLLTGGQTASIAAAGYGIGIGLGLWIALEREPRVLPLGLVGLVCAYGYHAPPLRLSYRGLGELAVGLCYGPLLAAGAYLVQRGEVRREAILAAVPLGLLVAAFLWINEFPDARADAEAGKKTLVVRLGRRRASRAFAGIVGLAFGLLAVLPLLGVRRGVWLGGLGLPSAVAAAAILLRHPEVTRKVVPAQALTLLAFVLEACGSGVGFLLST
ncbi:MAG TPA: prenyltransferase [Planctomycetota bacterium]|jgi:1,4-dihydroxy-2-naphthoate octaprenyltransferase|nr:prenyltransferase [Planctomycetota bacterium]